MRKVIFIGGTSYSGSTFLDMILANDPKGFSCGEVYALFHPFRRYHIHPICGCGDKGCNIWTRILKNGEKHLYETIFDMFPNVEFIVDSSKNPFWISRQIENLDRKNIMFQNIIIYKNPLDLAYSFKKRGKLYDWEKNFINYHRLYFSLIEIWRAVRYDKLVRDEFVLKELCRYLNIPYFKGKEMYWKKKHHTLFGNTSAKIHLYSEENNEFKKGIKELTGIHNNSEALENYRTIYYKNVMDKELEEYVKKRSRKNKEFDAILNFLSRCDVMENEKVMKSINLKEAPRMSKNSILLRKMKQDLIHKIFEIKLLVR